MKIVTKKSTDIRDGWNLLKFDDVLCQVEFLEEMIEDWEKGEEGKTKE